MTSRSKASSKAPSNALWAALALPLLLAACQTGQGPASRPASSPTAIARPGAADTGAAHGTSSSGAPLPPTADLVNDPARFKGLTGADVTSLLGPPSFQRHDGDAEIWQYYGPSSACVLDLFVYPDQGQPRVAHAEVRLRGAGSSSGCLAAILDGKRG